MIIAYYVGGDGSSHPSVCFICINGVTVGPVCIRFCNGFLNLLSVKRVREIWMKKEMTLQVSGFL